jgi:uncharacterized protein with PQ loop repeat
VVDAIGWLSSLVLVVTVGQQVLKQWRARDTRGVSVWLFVGQLVASGGFLVYSVLVANWVFVVTNALMLINALLGQAIVIKNRRRGETEPAPADATCTGTAGVPH